MKQLELKYLAPYLPYELKGQFLLSKVIGISRVEKDEIREKKLTAENLSFFLAYCIPKLRPMSDLTKEIEINGIKFVPLKELLRYSNFDVDKMTTKQMLEYEDTFTNPIFTTYDDNVKLIEWHFDVFGLIPNGLATNINTINT